MNQIRQRFKRIDGNFDIQGVFAFSQQILATKGDL